MNRDRRATSLAAFCAVVLWGGPSAPDAAAFDDATIRADLPAAWRITGEAGEYRLESEEQEIASLLILSPEPDRTLEERLAEIEEQFHSTGIITLETSSERIEDGESVHYRRYRLTPAGESDQESEFLLHQYSFWRAGVQVLLQIETPPGLSAQEDLFFRVFQTLEIREIPEPFLYGDARGDEDVRDEGRGETDGEETSVRGSAHDH